VCRWRVQLPHNNGSWIDIWYGAGPPAHSSKRFRSLHVPAGGTGYGSFRGRPRWCWMIAEGDSPPDEHEAPMDPGTALIADSIGPCVTGVHRLALGAVLGSPRYAQGLSVFASVAAPGKALRGVRRTLDWSPLRTDQNPSPETSSVTYEPLCAGHGLSGLAAMRLDCGLSSRPCAARNSCACTTRPASPQTSTIRSGITS
jgi:hypothetical protein